MNILPFLTSSCPQFLEKLKKSAKKAFCFFFPNSSRILHTNACGDFTLLAAEDWGKLKGYPEWNMFSWHIDSVLLYQARQQGIKFQNLPRKMPIYHIEHEIGSGYSPEGASLLFRQLDLKGIPYLNNSDLKKLVSEMKHSKQKVVYNQDNWGMADLSLENLIIR